MSSPTPERMAALVKSAQQIVGDAERTHDSMGRFDLERPSGPGGSMALSALVALLPEARALLAALDGLRFEAEQQAARAVEWEQRCLKAEADLRENEVNAAELRGLREDAERIDAENVVLRAVLDRADAALRRAGAPSEAINLWAIIPARPSGAKE